LANKKESPALAEAQKMLPPELHSVLNSMIAEYKFAALKVHGAQLVSPKVIAELILLGWRNTPDGPV
jgi:hypothetical protein